MLTIDNTFPPKRVLTNNNSRTKDYREPKWFWAKHALIVHCRQNSCLSENPCCCKPKCFYFGSFSLDDPDCCCYNNNTSMFNSLQCRDNAFDSHTEICEWVLWGWDFARHWQIETEKEWLEVRGKPWEYCHKYLKYIHKTPFLLIMFYFYKHPHNVISGHPWAASQSCFITIWFILPTGTMIRKLIVLPSPQRADYWRHNMKHSAETGSCFFCVNKSIRCTVPE